MLLNVLPTMCPPFIPLSSLCIPFNLTFEKLCYNAGPYCVTTQVHIGTHKQRSRLTIPRGEVSPKRFIASQGMRAHHGIISGR